MDGTTFGERIRELPETLKAWKKVFSTDFFDQQIADAEAQEKRRTAAGVAAPAVVSAPKSYCYPADATS